MRFVLEHYQPEFVTNVDVLSYAGNPENLAGVAEEQADRYEPFQSDIADREEMEAILSQHKFYAIVNFAAESHVGRSIPDPGNFVHTNIIGTEVLLETARKHGVKRFMQVSTTKFTVRSGRRESSLSPRRWIRVRLIPQARRRLTCWRWRRSRRSTKRW